MLLHEKLKGKKLILASKSPRRRELMTGCGFEFRIADGYDVEEKYSDDIPPVQVPLYLAELKSEAYPYPLADDEILITADTVVLLGDKILEKPKDRADAVRMVAELSGEKHTVVSGVVIRSNQGVKSFAAKTDVWIRKLRDEEIEYYVDTFEPYDKAGAYGIQEWLGYAAVSRIEGSFYNVMGLPIQALYVNLERFLDGEE